MNIFYTWKKSINRVVIAVNSWIWNLMLDVNLLYENWKHRLFYLKREEKKNIKAIYCSFYVFSIIPIQAC